MKRIFALLASVTLIHAAIAAPTHQHPLPKNPADFSFVQQMTDIVHAKIPSQQSNNAVLNEKAYARHTAFMKEWQAYNANSRFKNLMAPRIEKMLSNPAAMESVRMNILDLQTSDALEMLGSIQTAAQETQKIISMLADMALKAANGALPDSERQTLDGQFARLIALLPYFQSVMTLDGEKLLSGGDVLLKFGKDSHADAQYLIKIPSFTSEALGLTNLSIASEAQANQALSELSVANDTVNTVLATTGTGYLGDAQNMVYNLGYMLQDDLTILAAMRDLSVPAVQGCYSSSKVCSWYESDFDYLKALMQKTQAYLSLKGVVNQSYGDLFIQIGKQATDATTLMVTVPVTNLEMTGISDLHMEDFNSAYGVLRQTNGVMREFAYGLRA